MCPFAKFVRHKTRDIQRGTAGVLVIHSEIPAHLLAPEVFGTRLALEENPTLAIYAGPGETIGDGSLAGGGLIAGRVKPGFHRKALRVGRVERCVPGHLGACSKV